MTEHALVAHPAGRPRPIGVEWLDLLAVCIVAATLTGVLVAGPALRLGMLALRLTSPDSVVGLESDDGFTIGEVTLSGTYNLFQLGVLASLFGCLAWVLVEPWLVGPAWFRRFTFVATAAVVVGPMLIHDDGFDFHILEPLTLAIAIFLAIPALVGLAAPWALSVVDRHRFTGHLRWLLPLLCLALFPFSIAVLVMVAPVLLAAVALRLTVQPRLQGSPVGSTLVRAVFLAVLVLGAVALAADLSALGG